MNIQHSAKEKDIRLGKFLLFLMSISIAFYIGLNYGQSDLLDDINEYGEVNCEKEYCTLYLDGSDVWADFQISRIYFN